MISDQTTTDTGVKVSHLRERARGLALFQRRSRATPGDGGSPAAPARPRGKAPPAPGSRGSAGTVVARQRAVGEEHEGRRPVADLGGVVELPRPCRPDGRRVGAHRLLEQAVDLAGAQLGRGSRRATWATAGNTLSTPRPVVAETLTRRGSASSSCEPRPARSSRSRAPRRRADPTCCTTTTAARPRSQIAPGDARGRRW